MYVLQLGHLWDGHIIYDTLGLWLHSLLLLWSAHWTKAHYDTIVDTLRYITLLYIYVLCVCHVRHDHGAREAKGEQLPFHPIVLDPVYSSNSQIQRQKLKLSLNLGNISSQFM